MNPNVAAFIAEHGEFDYRNEEQLPGETNMKIEGPLLFPNGAVYFGELLNDMRHGKGK